MIFFLKEVASMFLLGFFLPLKWILKVEILNKVFSLQLLTNGGRGIFFYLLLKKKHASSKFKTLLRLKGYLHERIISHQKPSNTY